MATSSPGCAPCWARCTRRGRPGHPVTRSRFGATLGSRALLGSRAESADGQEPRGLRGEGVVMSIPADMVATARAIAAAQLPSGAIPWPDGHVDPWDHVECAMALSACGLRREA